MHGLNPCFQVSLDVADQPCLILVELPSPNPHKKRERNMRPLS